MLKYKLIHSEVLAARFSFTIAASSINMFGYLINVAADNSAVSRDTSGYTNMISVIKSSITILICLLFPSTVLSVNVRQFVAAVISLFRR